MDARDESPRPRAQDATQSHPGSGLVAALVVLATLGGLLLWVWMIVTPWRLASGLLDAGDHLERSEKALSNTSLNVAQEEVFSGAAAATRAEEGLAAGSPLLDLARFHPTADSALDEVEHLVDASSFSASAARRTLKIAKNALRGPTEIIAADPQNPKDSIVRLERIEEVAASIDNLRSDLEGVQEELSAIDLKNLPKRVRPDVDNALESAAEAETVIADAQAGFEILPGVLGGEGPRTYLIGMQNPAEQRGTGGAILRFAVFTFEDGRPDIKNTTKKDCPKNTDCPEGGGFSVYDIDKNRKLYDIKLPDDAWYVQGIDDAHRFGNANWSPDWPLSAELMLDYGEAADDRLAGDQLPDIDGFITVDPIVMEQLIPGTGPFRLERFGNDITANRAVHFLLYKAYASYPRPGVRRAALRGVVDQFIDKLFNPAHPTELVSGMSESLSSKHMMIWMKDPDEQAFIERMNWDGAIEPAKRGDYLYWVEQNVGGNKFDYYTEHETTMDVEIDGSDAVVSSETTIHNETFFPQPSWAMGDSGLPAPDGSRTTPTHEPMMNLYVPGNARLSDARVKGTRVDTPPPAGWDGGRPPEHQESGKKVWSATLEIPPGEDGSVGFDYRVPDVIREEDGRSSYTLTVQHQPRVRPETLEIRLALPDDADAIVAPGWEREADVLVWSKPLRSDMVLKVTWE